MTLSIKNGGYAFLIRLDLMFSMSLWKEFQLLETLNDLSIKRLIKLILYESDVKLLKFRREPNCEMNTSRKAMEWLICFSIINSMLGCLLFKKSKKVNDSCSLSKAARIHQHILNKS